MSADKTSTSGHDLGWPESDPEGRTAGWGGDPGAAGEREGQAGTRRAPAGPGGPEGPRQGIASWSALYDRLTGLPNRALLYDRLNQALARARRNNTSLALISIDLESVGEVDLRHGEEAGDELLIECGQRLRCTVRPSDTVARVGDEEFVVLCEELHSEREAIEVAERAGGALEAPHTMAGSELAVRANVGIVCGEAGSSAQELLRDANVAMKRARRRGQGVELFQAAMHAAAIGALETEHDLRGAIERDELELYYQPVLAIRGPERPLGVEALLRWRRMRRGVLLPGEFVSLAEETGLIVPVGRWALETACATLAGWRREGAVPETLTMSVNLSMHQLATASFIDTVSLALETSGLPPRCLCLEVTESSVAQDPRGAASALHELKAMGVLLALDDFGTGYSSLSALTSYPVDIVKIDRSFVARVAEEGSAARMFEAVLGVVRAADLRAVAEGVENEQQLTLLRSVGCDAAQGFLFAPPAPAEQFVARLEAAAHIAAEG